jgi:hypothetical protein
MVLYDNNNKIIIISIKNKVIFNFNFNSVDIQLATILKSALVILSIYLNLYTLCSSVRNKIKKSESYKQKKEKKI